MHKMSSPVQCSDISARLTQKIPLHCTQCVYNAAHGQRFAGHRASGTGAKELKVAKTQITATGCNVRISYDDAFTGDRVTRTFFTRGAYIYESCYDGKDRQVCDRLETRGSTLHAPRNGAPLLDVIRSEYKAMRSAEKRDALRCCS